MRPEKSNIVRDVVARLKTSPFLIVADYSGLKVDQFSDLRNKLHEAGARCTVVKNTFVARATKELGLPDLSSHLSGQTAVVTGDKDVVAAAKVLKKFGADSKKFALRGGVVDNTLVDAKGLESLADLPSKEQLQAQLLGLLNAPASAFVRLLNEPGASLARLLQARIDKEGKPAEAAAA
ncbi:MAG: 50S ribosomal protein L10 [Verrucomicrobia bacterium]|nr:50S ribosomal protein L10 [Verrucomicrobiota bacterium]MBV9657403.1 50S ribosomal protein L10 [Verrucomicrobiota bacterium]